MTLRCRCGDPLSEHRLEAGEKRGEIDVRECRVAGCPCEKWDMAFIGIPIRTDASMPVGVIKLQATR